MLSKNKLTIIEWFVLILIMSIPIVNIVFLIWGLVKDKFSENLKNFIIAYFIFFIIFGAGIFQSGIL